MPQSPRTRIKTIVGKERTERMERTDRRDNCEIFENRMAISDFQAGVSDGKKNRSPRTPKENTKNKENLSPYSQSDSSNSVESPAPPKPPRSPRIERSVLGDSPTINKMNNDTNYSLSSSQVSSNGEDSVITSHLNSVNSEVISTSTAETRNICENSQSLVHNSLISSVTRNNVELSGDVCVFTSPEDKLVRNSSGTEGTFSTVDEEARGCNKVFEEHLIKNIQDTFNIDVSLLMNIIP